MEAVIFSSCGSVCVNRLSFPFFAFRSNWYISSNQDDRRQESKALKAMQGRLRAERKRRFDKMKVECAKATSLFKNAKGSEWEVNLIFRLQINFYMVNVSDQQEEQIITLEKELKSTQDQLRLSQKEFSEWRKEIVESKNMVTFLLLIQKL